MTQSFQVIPAIDMKDHQAVRLKQGLMNEATVYGSVYEFANKWIDEGARRLHLVDLNGAFEGQPVHYQEIANIIETHPHVSVQVGGGVRDEATLQKYLDTGVTQVILGSVLVKKTELVKDWVKKFPGKIILGVDAKKGMVATEGWAKGSSVRAVDLIAEFKDLPIHSVIYTDIAKDGMLQGMSHEQIEQVAAVGLPVIGSGGLTSQDDIDRLKVIPNVVGVIAGKALYEGLVQIGN